MQGISIIEVANEIIGEGALPRSSSLLQIGNEKKGDEENFSTGEFDTRESMKTWYSVGSLSAVIMILRKVTRPSSLSRSYLVHYLSSSMHKTQLQQVQTRRDQRLQPQLLLR